MKKFTKICLITSLVLIIIGGIISVIGVFTGGWRLVSEVRGDEGWWKVVDRVTDAYDWYPSDYRRNDWDNLGAGDYEKLEYKDTGIAGEEVTEMRIDIGGAALYLLEAEDNNFGFKKEGRLDYECYLERGTLHLESDSNRYRLNNLTDEKVWLYVPAGMDFDRISINVGAGMAQAGELHADEIDLEIGAGMLVSDRIVCRSLDVESGAGKVTLNGIEATDMVLNVGAGHAYAQGSVSGDIDVECGVGAVEVALSEDFEHYNYKVECAAGTVKLGDKSYSAFAADKYIDNRAQAECSLECAMGTIKIDFER